MDRRTQPGWQIGRKRRAGGLMSPTATIVIHRSLLAFDFRHDILARGVAWLPARFAAVESGRAERCRLCEGEGMHKLGEDARMTEPAESQEPSMEEILASIRRIIADDHASKSAPREAKAAAVPQSDPLLQPSSAVPATSAAAPPEPPAAAEIFAEESSLPAAAAADEASLEDLSSDILDLTESTAAATSNAPSAAADLPPQFHKIESRSNASLEESIEQPAVQRIVAEVRGRSVREDGGVGADERAQLLSSETRAAVDSAFNALAQTVLVQNARTLEDLVREMLRPMLKSWLDDNLPAMVERLVRAEIERVSRGRAG